MASSSSERVGNWWGTLNKMSKAEVYFRQTLDAKNHISTERGRAALLLRNQSTVRIYSRPEELPHSLRPHDLIVLEDLSREWVEALGPRLGIPVSVFALHWANPIDHVNGEVRVPIGESPTRHFILNYRQPLPFSILSRENEITVKGVKKGQLGEMACFRVKVFEADSNPDLEYRLDCNLVRPITSRSKTYKGYETSEQLVTYYATGNGASSKEHYVPCPLEVDCAHRSLDSSSCRSNDSDTGKSSPQSCSIR